MPVWRFDKPSHATISHPIQMGNYASQPIQVHFHKITAIRRAVDRTKDAYLDRRSLGKGLRWAFTFEGGTALFVYTLWHLWRLWR